MPIIKTTVRTLDCTTDEPCPRPARNAEKKYPAPLTNQTSGIDSAFANRGPSHGINANNPRNPANAWVKIPTSAAKAATNDASQPANIPISMIKTTISRPRIVRR